MLIGIVGVVMCLYGLVGESFCSCFCSYIVVV